MIDGVKQRRAFPFSAYFMAFLMVAVLFPGFRILTEWIAPPLFIYPVTITRMGNMMLLMAAFVVFGNPAISLPILGMLYAIDVYILGRLLRGLSGGHPVFFRSLFVSLKFYVRFVVFAYFYSVMVMSLFFGLPEHAVTLLFALSAVVLGVSLNEKWHDVMLVRGWKPVFKLWPLLAAAVLFSGLSVLFERPARNLPFMIAGVACLAGSIVIARRRIKPPAGVSAWPFALNTNVLALPVFFISCIIIVDQFVMASKKAPVISGVHEIIRAGSVYDVLPDEETGDVFFTTLDNNKAVGKVAKNGDVSWTGYRRLEHMERILNVKSMDSIAVFGRNGYFLFSKDNLRMTRRIHGNKSNVDAEISPGGDMIYGVREYDNYLYMISTNNGLLRTYRMGSRLLCPYTIHRVSPTVFFVGNWFTSPFMLKITLKQDSIHVQRKTIGYFTVGIASDPKRNRLYVARSLFNRIEVVDMDTMKVIGEIPVKGYPREIIYDEERDILVAPGYYSGRIDAVDFATGAVYHLPSVGSEVRGVKLGGDVLYFATGEGVYSLDWGRRWRSLLKDAEPESQRFKIEKN